MVKIEGAADTAFIRDEPWLLKSAVLFAQMALYPLMSLMRRIIVGKRLTWHGDIRYFTHSRHASYILYANHQSKVDPMILSACLPFSVAMRLMPFRVMVSNEHLAGWLGRIFRMVGGFPAFPSPGASFGLDRARVILAARQTVIIFPQGMRTRERVARTGLSVLATEPGVRLIPARLDWSGRYRCSVHIGQPFICDEPVSPDELMRSVYDLSLAGQE